MSEKTQESSIVSAETSGTGCFALVVGIVLLWAMVFGVTINGRHYGLAGCDSDTGVRIDTGGDS